MKIKTIFTALAVLFASDDNPLDAKVVFYYDGKIANDKVDYKVRIVQTNNEELNKKFERDFCQYSLSFVREDQVKECLNKNDIHQAIKDDIADIEKEAKKYPSFRGGIRDYEQTFKYLDNKKYFKICHIDDVLGGTMNIHLCDLYDITDPKNPVLSNVGFLSDEQYEKIKLYFAKHGEQFGVKKEISTPCEEALANGGINKYKFERKFGAKDIVTWDQNISSVCQSEADKELLENLEPNAGNIAGIVDIEVSKTDDGKYDIGLIYSGLYDHFWWDWVYVDEKTLKELVPKEFLE